MRAAATEIVLTALTELPAIASLSLFIEMIAVWAGIISHGI